MSRTILITGGSGKFGRAMVTHFLQKGDRVVFTARSDGSINSVIADNLSYADHISGIVTDFNEQNACTNLLEELQKKGLLITDLVNNARSLENLAIQPDGTVTRDNFVGEFLIDVVAPYELTMALANREDSQLQRVVNIGSQYGHVAANPGLYDDPSLQSPLHYGVAKAALEHLTRELAVRLADRNIRVNCVAFGGVEGRVDEAFLNRYAALTPQRRMLQVSEVSGPVDFLLSRESSAMTGQIVAADGGWGIW